MRIGSPPRLARRLAWGVALLFLLLLPTPTSSADEAPARRLALAPLPAPAMPPTRAMAETLPLDDGGRVVTIPAPSTAAERAAEHLVGPRAAPVAAVLHGACGGPSLCDRFAGRVDGWLLCPTGNQRCGEAWDWRGEAAAKAAHLAASRRALAERWPAQVATEGSDVIIGFSRGAFAARDILYAATATSERRAYRGAVFIGAAFVPDVDRLRAAGVERVVFACGDHDGARPTMLKATAVVSRGGLGARFVSLGPRWHELPADAGERLADALRWVQR